VQAFAAPPPRGPDGAAYYGWWGSRASASRQLGDTWDFSRPVWGAPTAGRAVLSNARGWARAGPAWLFSRSSLRNNERAKGEGLLFSRGSWLAGPRG